MLKMLFQIVKTYKNNNYLYLISYLRLIKMYILIYSFILLIGSVEITFFTYIINEYIQNICKYTQISSVYKNIVIFLLSY